MKTTSAVILSVLLLVFAACAQKVNDPADVEAIKKSMADFEKAVNAGDAGAIAALMTDKTVWADANVPVVIGAEAIRSQWQPFFGQYSFEFSGPVEEVRVTGEVAVTRGPWKIKATPKAQGEAVFSDSGTWMVVFARQSDASWKWDWLVANSNQPLPGSTASGEDEQALYQLQRDWVPAYLNRDTAVIEKFLADDFVSNWDGQAQNKKQHLAQVKSNPARVESASNTEMRAMVFGETAVVRGVWAEKSTTAGKDSSSTHRYTEVYVKRDGRWQCVTQYGVKVE